MYVGASISQALCVYQDIILVFLVFFFFDFFVLFGIRIHSNGLAGFGYGCMVGVKKRRIGLRWIRSFKLELWWCAVRFGVKDHSEGLRFLSFCIAMGLGHFREQVDWVFGVVGWFSRRIDASYFDVG